MYRTPKLGARHRRPVIDGLGYGIRPELGGLFDDAMKAIVPGWDQRPDWMKKIKIKLKPERMLEQARVFAPEAAKKVEHLIQTQAQKIGGQYVWTKAEEAAQNPIVWIGGGVLVLLILGQFMGGRR